MNQGDAKTSEHIQYWMIHLQNFWALSPTSQPQILLVNFISGKKNKTDRLLINLFQECSGKGNCKKNDWYI